ncbi:MAG TPA: prepilin peptidase [Tepidisphaeraceae bacterium]|jgi:leader peptidase (prepilin peptidase)/N-methyltransferase
MPIATHLFFLFCLGACVGSFLNVVVWRLPRGQSLVFPPSRCPTCEHRLAWYDNVPIFGWIFLAGKCRYCKERISPRYPIVELITALLFVGCYLLLFVMQIGPGASTDSFVPDPSGGVMLRGLNPFDHWPLLLLYLTTICCLLAASLIDLELFVIPLEIPYFLALVAIVIHALADHPTVPGALNLSTPLAALSAGAFLGLILSIVLWALKIFPTSFAEGEPMLEVDKDLITDKSQMPPEYSPAQIRFEIGKEMLFLTPPLILGALAFLLYQNLPAVHAYADQLARHDWLTGLLGSLLGAMVGGFTVWLTRIFGTLGFGRVAMGLGDVHLMFGVGAVIGAAAAVVAFFVAPFFGLLIALYFLITGKRREVPYGPYLSLGTICVMFFYANILRFIGWM